MKKIAAAISLAGAILVGYTDAYQMSNVTVPSYPVIIPAPMNLEYHNASTNVSLIDPCKLKINWSIPSSYDKDTQGYINSTINWYLNKYIYIKGASCVAK